MIDTNSTSSPESSLVIPSPASSPEPAEVLPVYPGPVALLGESIILVKNNFSKLGLLFFIRFAAEALFIIVMGGAALATLSQIYNLVGVPSVLSGPVTGSMAPLPAPNSGMVISLAGVMFIAIILKSLFDAWCDIGFVVIFSHEGFTFPEIVRKAFSKLGDYLITYLLVGLILLGSGLLFILPAVFVAIRALFLTYTVVVENQKGITAFLKSRFYILNHLWGLVGRSLVFVLIILLISAGAESAFPKDPSVFQKIILAAINLFITVLSLAYSYLNYKHIALIDAGKTFDPNKGRTKYIVLACLPFLLLIGIFLFIANMISTL